MKTYSQAMKPKDGWAHADDESMCAATADLVARYCCLNAKFVYAWIKKHYGTDWRTVHAMRGKDKIPYYDLVGPILSDKKVEM